MVGVNMLMKGVKAYNRAGSVQMPMHRLLSIRRRPTTHSTANPGALWTAEAQSLLAQCRLVGSSVPEGVISVLAWRDGNTLGRPSISAESAVRRNAHAWVMRRCLTREECFKPSWMLCPTSPVLRCDDGSSAVPRTVAPLRCLAVDVKRLPGWEEDVRINSVNIVDVASNLQHN